MMLAALLAACTLAGTAQQADAGSQPGHSNDAKGLDMVGMAQDLMGPGLMGQGVVGTVIRVAADHYVVKTLGHGSYTVDFSANTRIFRQAPPRAGGQGGGAHELQPERTAPTEIRASEIKVGDVIMARGEVAPGDRSLGAIFIVQLDARSAKRLEQMQASFGKTWLMGRITAIKGDKITVEAGTDQAVYSFVTNEKTEVRSRRDLITAADLTVGEYVHVDGVRRNGQFIASSMRVMLPRPRGGPVPRPGNAPPR